MNRGFFNFGRILIVLLGICLVLGSLNFMGVLNVKDLFIQGLSYIPGLEDLSENYELGKKRSKLLGEREAELKNREEQLQRDQTKLEEEQDLLLAEKLVWEREHPVSTGSDGTGLKLSAAQKGALAKEEAELKYYLATLGSMKPKNAAMVIQKLPENTIYLIFDQLQQSQVRKILENMPAEYLAKLTQDRLNKYRNR